jgi:hypothetical protein
VYEIRYKLLNIADYYQNICSVRSSVNPSELRTAGFFYKKNPWGPNHNFSWFWSLVQSLSHVFVTEKSSLKFILRGEKITWSWKSVRTTVECGTVWPTTGLSRKIKAAKTSFSPLISFKRWASDGFWNLLGQKQLF